MGRHAMATPRIRSLDWDVSDKLRSMRVLNGQIILMWEYEIRVYGLQTLECTRKIEINIVKSYLRERLDYADSNGDHVFGIFRFNDKLRMWNVKTGRMLLDKIKINRSKHGISKMASVSVLRCWKNDVVIGSSLGELTLWQFKNKTLKFKHKWMASFSNSVDRVELDDHVIVSLLTLHFLVEIWDKGGNRLGKLHGPEVFTSLRYFNGLIAASWTGSTVKIWNASTGECIGQVAHSEGYSTSVEINGKYLVSGDSLGSLSVWSLDDVLSKGPTPAVAEVAPLYTAVGPTGAVSSAYKMMGLEGNFLVCYQKFASFVEVMELQ